jgi:CelD/BcsL family acetyltransferase involved in cellulose biosynthesis
MVASSSRQLMITEPGQIDEIEAQWRALAERRSNAFATPEWVRAWWSHSADERFSLRIAALLRGDELVGVMPLAIDASRRPRAIRFAGAGLGDRFHPVAEPEDEPAVAAAAMALLQQEDLSRHMLMFENVEPDRPWLGELRRASPRRLAVTEQQSTELPYVPLEGLDWDGYLAQRSRGSRSNLRRRERVLVREHGMTLRSAGEGSLEADLDHFFRLHAMRWAERGSSLDSPRRQGVLRDFAAAAQRRGWLRLTVMEADGSPVAAMLGWRVGDSYAYYNSGFDPAWSQRSVGTVLITSTIRAAIEEGASEYDFLLGTEDYKGRFAAASREAATVVLTGAMRPSRLLLEGESRLRRHGRRLAELPGLAGVTRRLRRTLPTSRP